MRRARLAALGACALLGLAARGAAAQTVSCMAAATGVAFGGYLTITSAPTDGTGTITVTCTTPGPGNGAVAVTFVVTLSGGSSGNTGARRMVSGGNQLAYQLYRNTARTNVWGNTAAQGLSRTGQVRRTRPLTRILTVYGRIPARQNVPVGSYTDSIVVTVTY